MRRREPADPGFSGKRAAEIVNVSYRQLDYWARTNLIRPSLADGRGSGGCLRDSYRDLIELKLVKTLLDIGIKLETVREAFTYVREQLSEDVSSAKLVLSGKSAVLVRDTDELIDVVSRYKGEGVLNFLDLGDVKGDIDAALVELVPIGRQPMSDASATDNQPGPGMSLLRRMFKRGVARWRRLHTGRSLV